LWGRSAGLGLGGRSLGPAQGMRAESRDLGADLLHVRSDDQVWHVALVAHPARRRRGGALSIDARLRGELVRAHGARPCHLVLVDRNDDRTDAGWPGGPL